jgi:hypothetical protein
MKWTHYKINNITDISLTKLLIHNVNVLSNYYVLFLYDTTEQSLYYYIFYKETEITNYKIDFTNNILLFNKFDVKLITGKSIIIKYDIYINILNKIYNDNINPKKIKVSINDNIQIIHKSIYDLFNSCDIDNFEIFIDIIYNDKYNHDNKIIIDDCEKLLLNNEYKLLVEIIILKIFLITHDFTFINDFTFDFKYLDNIVKQFQ